MTNWSYIAHIKRRIIQNKWQKFWINIYFSQNFLPVAIFSLNTVYLQLPHSKEAFWVYKGSVKCERIHKLHKNRENYVNSYVAVLTPFSHCYKVTCKQKLNIYVFNFLCSFVTHYDSTFNILSKIRNGETIAAWHSISLQCSRAMWICFLISQLHLTHESSL